MILFIDDEPRFIAPYIDAFKLSQFDVVVKDSVDEALEFIKKNKDDIDVVMLDIMMPPGRILKGSDTKEGLRTGLRFIELMKEIDEQIPIVCLTNADSKKFRKIDHSNYLIFEKKEIDPWELLDKMYDIKRRKKL